MKIPFYAEFLFFYAEYNNMGANSYEKPDFWSKKAFSEGYPARSVYKLKEMNEKFSLLKKNSTVLDLGSAPGSWTVFLLRNLKISIIKTLTIHLKIVLNQYLKILIKKIQGKYYLKNLNM